MAKSYHNIDAPWRKGADYVGYANGIWHIRKVGARWRATKIADSGILSAGTIYGDTLGDISAALEAHAKRLAA